MGSGHEAGRLSDHPRISEIVARFEREAASTRRFLERLPESRLDWRPHPKSYTARGLASHLVECLGWTESIFGADELDVDPATYRPYEAASLAQLLEDFDATVVAGRRALASASDADLERPWRLKISGKVRTERPKAAAFTDFTLDHVIHHRGQLSVYLRLLDVPVPGAYGPTADDRR